MFQKDADGMAKSVDWSAVWSRTTLFAQTCLSKNLGIVWLIFIFFFIVITIHGHRNSIFLSQSFFKNLIGLVGTYSYLDACFRILPLWSKKSVCKLLLTVSKLFQNGMGLLKWKHVFCRKPKKVLWKSKYQKWLQRFNIEWCNCFRLSKDQFIFVLPDFLTCKKKQKI